jgi:hypothetical protein
VSRLNGVWRFDDVLRSDSVQRFDATGTDETMVPFLSAVRLLQLFCLKFSLILQVLSNFFKFFLLIIRLHEMLTWHVSNAHINVDMIKIEVLQKGLNIGGQKCYYGN